MNTKIRIISIIAACIVTLTMLAGCGSTSQSYAESASYMPDYFDSYEDSYNYDMALNEIDTKESYGANSAAISGQQTVTTQPAETPSGQSNIERKIVRDADISIKADKAEETYQKVLNQAKALGGYEADINMYKNESETYKSVNISAILKLPPDKLDSFVDWVSSNTDVTNCNVTSEEITESYYDLKTRLESKQKALESYYALLEKAETVDDILNIQYRIDNMTEEIESIKGRLRVYDSMVDESTVNLSITESYQMPIEEKEFTWDSLTFSSFLKLIRNGFLGVCNFIWSLLQWLVIIVLSASPLLIIAAAIIFGIRKYRKTHPRKPKPAKTYAPAYTPSYTAPTVPEDRSHQDGDE